LRSSIHSTPTRESTILAALYSASQRRRAQITAPGVGFQSNQLNPAESFFPCRIVKL
jgi:hypothetical protein